MLAKKSLPLNSNTDKVCLSPSSQLLQQSVELFINLRAVPGRLQAQQDPCKGQRMNWLEADEDLDLGSRKDVHKGTLFPRRSYRVTLRLLPSNMDVFQPVSVIHRTRLFSYHLLNTRLRFVWKFRLSVGVPTCACGGYSCELRATD